MNLGSLLFPLSSILSLEMVSVIRDHQWNIERKIVRDNKNQSRSQPQVWRGTSLDPSFFFFFNPSNLRVYSWKQNTESTCLWRWGREKHCWCLLTDEWVGHLQWPLCGLIPWTWEVPGLNPSWERTALFLHWKPKCGSTMCIISKYNAY